MENNGDYSQYRDLNQNSEMTQLQELARAQVNAEREVQRCEQELKAAQKVLADIAEKELPELMDSIGLETFTAYDGTHVEITEKIRTSIPKDRAEEAFLWLRSTGNGRLIKRVISTQLAMGQDELANAVHQALEQFELDVSDKSQVHPSTLLSFVKRRLEAGEELPLDKISVHRQRISKIKA